MNASTGFLDKLNSARRRLSAALRDSFVVRFFTSEKKIESEISSSRVLKKQRESDIGVRMRSIRVKTASRIENSALSAVYRKIVSSMLNASAKVYATFFVSFAIYTAAVFFLRTYAYNINNGKHEDLVVAAAMLAVGIIMMFSDRSLIELIRTSAFGRTFLVKVLGVREAMLKPGEKRGGAIVAFIAGTAAGAMTVFVSPVSVISALFTGAAAMLAFSAPECGVTLLLLLFPFLSETKLAVGLCFVLLSYAVKVVRFKRNLKFGGAGTAVLLFGINVVLCGIVTASSIDGAREALLLTCGVACYFLCANLICTGQLVYCCVRSLLLGAGASVLITIVGYFLPAAENAVLIVTGGTGAISAVVLAVGGVIFAQRSRVNYSFFARTGSLLCFAATAAALYFTGDVSMWMIFTVGCVAVCICMYPLSAAAFALIGALSPLWWKIFDNTPIHNAVTEFASGTKTLSHLADSAANSYIFGGVGTGETALMMATSSSAGGGTVFSRLLVQGGLVSVVLMAAALVLITIRVVSKISVCEKRHYRALTAALLCGCFGILTAGMFTYVWADFATCAMFWSLCGLACASADCFGEDPDVMRQ